MSITAELASDAAFDTPSADNAPETSSLDRFFANIRRAVLEGQSISRPFVALNLARELIKRDLTPGLLVISAEAGSGEQTFIKPEGLEGEGWHEHIVCTMGEQVYDPILTDFPTTRDHYLDKVFATRPAIREISGEVLRRRLGEHEDPWTQTASSDSLPTI